jgi:hypothetical protein
MGETSLARSFAWRFSRYFALTKPRDAVACFFRRDRHVSFDAGHGAADGADWRRHRHLADAAFAINSLMEQTVGAMIRRIA